ncbi:tagatose kinase [Azospirillum sp. ST 5-10]|uniref:tagatose kinase n=1 Tax=unclassified Azospirillum TaxID=2630922 RepID=UPI003F4A4B08
MKTIVTIGEVLVEIMAVEPGHGFRRPIPLVGPFPSGAPAIFIDQVAKLGQPCGIVACVGDDDFGALNVARLRADGVDVSAIAVAADVPTGSAFVRYRPDGQRDFVFNIKHSACGRIGPTPQAAALIARADHLHVMGSALVAEPVVALIRDALDAVKGRGGTVSFDPNIRKEMLGLPGLHDALLHVFRHTDLFLPSGPELFLFTRATEEDAAIAEILEGGVRAVVVKRGAAGASHHDRGGSTRVAAFPVAEVDPTGAGDCFGAIFVTAWLRGLEPRRALLLANAGGARAVTVKGPMEGTSTEAELTAFLARHSNGDAS